MSPTRRELEAWDDAHVWHPFTPHSVYREEDPLLVVRGEGNHLIDPEGNRYLDAVSSLWCNLFGHRHPTLNAAIAAQLDEIAHATFLGNATAPAITLARRLVEVTPDPLTRVFYSDSGSTAVEVALKIALQYWQQCEGGARRKRFLTMANAYHGDTVGAVSLGGMDLFHARYAPLLFDTLKAPCPDTYRRPEGETEEAFHARCIAETTALIRTHGDELAGVFLEPCVQGAAGMITQPPGFLRAVAAAAKEAGTLLILDEVATGFGRSGETLFACQQQGVDPDILCMAKGLTGGYLPLAATLATEPIFEAFLGPPVEGRTFFHGHTYTGNPLASAAALATLDIFEEERILEKLPAVTEHFAERVESLRDCPGVGDVRRWGLMAGIEIVADKASRRSYPAEERRAQRVCRVARDHGVFLRPLGDTLVLVPPLSIQPEEIECIRAALAAALQQVCGDSS